MKNWHQKTMLRRPHITPEELPSLKMCKSQKKLGDREREGGREAGREREKMQVNIIRGEK
jgi:hypothetical protein